MFYGVSRFFLLAPGWGLGIPAFFFRHRHLHGKTRRNDTFPLHPREKTGPLRSRPHHIRFLLAEVALQQAFERLAVAGLVAGHLMHGVVNGVEVELLGLLGQLKLAGGGAVSASTRISRFFLVESVTTSPSSSANLAACSASS